MSAERLDLSATGRSTSSASATLDLREVAEKERFSVNERIALQDAGTRKHIAYGIMATFVAVNLFTLVFLWHLTSMDNDNVQNKETKPYSRVIDHSVIMSLLGASTIQLGSLAVIMTKYLFPIRDNNSNADRRRR